MWAPIAIRRILALTSQRTIKPIDASQIFATNYLAVTGSAFNLIPVRYKTKSRKKPKATNNDGDESESEDEGEDLGENPMLMNDLISDSNDGSRELLLDVNSLRLDVIAKNSFSVSRLKAEEALLKGDIFVNGEKPYKKSQDVRVGDEIDYIKQLNPEDPTMVDIKRVQILEFPDKSDSHGRLKIKARLYPDLTIKSPRKED